MLLGIIDAYYIAVSLAVIGTFDELGHSYLLYISAAKIPMYIVRLS